ncbi:MAG: type II toxin-antitoxin system VapC family toxin [Candidatus Methylumidiphilus sp.]|nr:type II toxin-antitoxin system VapC family toxin [Pseudomonadota bacterium]
MTLLDTHVWLRWLPGSEQLLPDTVRQTIRTGGQLMISAVSVWEALYLARAGRLDLGFPWEEWLSKATSGAKVEVISISTGIAACAAHLPLHHRDPADRFIIATALELDVQLISLDDKFPLYEELAGRLFAP